jgi:hypothetical protein
MTLRSSSEVYKGMTVRDMIGEAFISGEEFNRAQEDANVVDGLFAIARGLQAVASAIRDKKPESTTVLPVADVRPGDFRL